MIDAYLICTKCNGIINKQYSSPEEYLDQYGKDKICDICKEKK